MSEIFVVTGAAGFIGSHLIQSLLDLNHRVVGLDNFSGSKIDNLAFLNDHPNHHLFTFIEADIRDSEACTKAIMGSTYVLHQAALGSVPRSIKEPHLYHENNLTGTFNVLMAAKTAGVKQVVFASSSSVYGNTPTLPKEENMPVSPLSPYAVSKLGGEGYISAFYHSYGLRTVALRYFNVFGPRQNPHSQYAAVIPKFVTACKTSQPITIYGDGQQSRDFTFVQNVVKANILAATQCPESLLGKPVNVGCGHRISVLELARKIGHLSGKKVPIHHLPPREGDVRDSLASINQLHTLGLTHPLGLDEGLQTTVSWYLNEH